MEVEAETPVDFKGSWVSLSEPGFQTSFPSVNTENHIEAAKPCYWALAPTICSTLGHYG